MQMSGEELINASRAEVWDALNDPEILRQSIPGCQTVEKVSDTEFSATVKVKVGPVSAKFNGHVTLSNIDAPNGYTITGEGKGGAAGFGKGGADISLKESDNGTLLSYDVNASVGGKMAQIGSRLIDGTAKKLASEFFANFNELVSSGREEHAEEPLAAEEMSASEPAVPDVSATQEKVAPPPLPDAEKAASPDWMRPSILIPLGIIAAVILFYLAGD
ncbi:SRPBCC family protein [Sneathiella sp. HT1-7]|uniref:SRPBCC family protein n=1 Tax=Sneathiella sp. HT1-7 TaxID=2887192 RepID=UPI001D1331F7|nr:carbon monoxide dehydrogenase subunit G [Sneathiella sp. HT1-7]MCC3306244.1 carbon monoxide dehydrogenase subunit G [Sneathiella sp. HT1-7]